MEGLVDAAPLVDLMARLLNIKILNTYTGVGAMHRALKGIADGNYTNLLTLEQRDAATDSLVQPYPAVLQLLVGVDGMVVYLRRLFTSDGSPELLDSLLQSPYKWPEVEEALA
jgi:hypothetical protein